MLSISGLRQNYHRQLCSKIIRLRGKKGALAPNFADSGSVTSRAIANKIVDAMGCIPPNGSITGQKAGRLFEAATKMFLEQAFRQLNHLRPGRWRYSTSRSIADFDQYAHLADLERIVERSDELRAALGEDYIIQPDIVISRDPVTDEEINQDNLTILDSQDTYVKLTPLRAANHHPLKPLLHASISCKWTVRSDRAQNTRTEALNLIRNRKGNLPHIMIVTAEPLPTRLASLALGTGDVDCVYHIALNELQLALRTLNNDDQMDMLTTLISGRRLRDISDLPFDLAI
jgi:hypothetical protein